MNTKEKRQRLAELNEQARDLSRQIEAESRRCNHEWGYAVYDPIMGRHMEYDHIEPHGSDPEFIYRDCGPEVKQPRWTQTCNKCGHTRSTTKTKVTATSPDFDS